ncbi:MAG TPA: T9SS type A sorting domain-containing protein [Bacteroidales bacterium]|nr:T9SS type A sorting domain-containing protein [Bacteroidales bacterium]
MKKVVFIIFCVFAFMPFLRAQGQMESTFELKYNQTNNLYEAHLHVGGIVDASGLDSFLGPSGFCVVLPVSAPDQPILCASHNPVSAGWTDNTPAYNVLTFDGHKDYHKFSTPGQTFVPQLNAGDDIILFTFSLPAYVCPSSVRMFENNSPSPSPTPDTNPAGQTFDNSFQTINGETFKSVMVNTLNPPAVPVIYQDGSTLYTSSTLNIQWYNDNGIIQGATSASYTPTSSGNYYIVVTDAFWCTSDTSNTISILITSVTEIDDMGNIETYPNPVVDELIITNHGNKKPIDFEIYNAIGEVVFKGVLKQKVKVDTKSFAAGAYMLKFDNGKTVKSKEIIKEY